MDYFGLKFIYLVVVNMCVRKLDLSFLIKESNYGDKMLIMSL